MACPGSAGQRLLKLLGALHTVTSTVAQPLFVSRPAAVSQLASRAVGKDSYSVFPERSASRRLDEEPSQNATNGTNSTNATADAGLPFDCEAALSNWQNEWSEMKMQWCCQHEQKGCQTTAAPSAADSSTASNKPFDCEAALNNFAAAWSPDKMEWCCKNEQKGCLAPAAAQSEAATTVNATEGTGAETVTSTSLAVPVAEFDCQVSLHNWQDAWGDVKKEWCCQHEQLGCPAPPTSVAPPVPVPPAPEPDPQAPAGAQQPGAEECEGSPESWSEERRQFCCRTKGLGCPEAPAVNAVESQTPTQEAGAPGQDNAPAGSGGAGEKQGGTEDNQQSPSGDTQGKVAGEEGQGAGHEQGGKEEPGHGPAAQPVKEEGEDAQEGKEPKEKREGEGGRNEERGHGPAGHPVREEGEDAQEGAKEKREGEGGQDEEKVPRWGARPAREKRERTTRASPPTLVEPSDHSSSGPGMYLVGLLSLGIPMVVYLFHCRGGKDMRRRVQSWGGIGASTIGRSSSTYTQMRTMSSAGSYVPPSF